MMADRFTAETRDERWTVVDHEERRRVVPGGHWSEETARLIARGLSRRPYHEDLFIWEPEA